MPQQDVIESLHRYVKRLGEAGIPVAFMVLYGSHARGNTHQWSDIDILVVSSVFDGIIRTEDVNLLWRIAGQTDSRIEPIACGLRQWSEDTSSAVIEIARREGQQIQAA